MNYHFVTFKTSALAIFVVLLHCTSTLCMPFPSKEPTHSWPIPCSVSKPCPKGLGCFVLPGLTTAYCEVAENVCSHCPGKESCAILESYPMQVHCQCEELGGQVVPCFTPSGTTCSYPTKDGGLPCASSSNCESECVARRPCKTGEVVEGICAHRTHLVCTGVQLVHDGRCLPTMIT